MPRTHTVCKQQAEEIARIRKGITDKRVDKRLYAVQLRGEGLANPAIAWKLDTSPKVVSNWVSAYCKGGIEALLRGRFGGNRRNMSLQEEQAFLEPYKQQAAQGQLIEVGAMRAAYEAKVGHSIGGGQIYRLLHRHGWRKVMPRSKHPNKASDEAIEASKKLIKRSETRWQIIPPELSD